VEKAQLVVGHVGTETARIWGRGNAQHRVMHVEATSSCGQAVKDSVELTAENGFTGVAQLSSLQPDTDYQVEVRYGDHGPSARGEFNTVPGPDQSRPFSMLLNSCNFHGWGPIRDNDQAIERRRDIARGVDMVIHAGDQVYADKAPISFSLQEFRQAYDKAWTRPATAELLSSQANYMLADDHEVVNGFALDGELTAFQRALLWVRGHGGPREEQYQELTANGLKAYQEFQNSLSPGTYGDNKQYYTFSHGKHQFFALDTRFERHNGQRQMISPEQQEALFAWLSQHREVPKFIITSSPFVMEKIDSEEKWSSPEFSAQRHQIIEFLAEQNIDKVTFLAGDIHASGHATMEIERAEGKPLVVHELCASPVNGTKQRRLDEFHLNTEATTAAGVRFRTRIDPDTFVGKEDWGGISNSSVMKIHVDGDEVRYEIHRTRQSEPGPARQGQFTM